MPDERNTQHDVCYFQARAYDKDNDSDASHVHGDSGSSGAGRRNAALEGDVMQDTAVHFDEVSFKDKSHGGMCWLRGTHDTMCVIFRKTTRTCRTCTVTAARRVRAAGTQHSKMPCSTTATRGTEVLLRRLSQEDKYGQLKLIACGSRNLNDAKKNYPPHEQECLVVIDALRRWKYYFRQPPHVFTDNITLKYLTTIKDPSKRMIRWISELAQYSLVIQHILGSTNTAAESIYISLTPSPY